MSGEVQVRFWENRWERFLPVTHRVLGLESNWDADTFLQELKRRLERFDLSLHEDKIRLIQYGHYARRDRPVIQQVKWLKLVVQGHRNYLAVLGNGRRLSVFRTKVRKIWYKALSSARTTVWTGGSLVGLQTLYCQRWESFTYGRVSGLASNTQGRSRIN